MAELFERISISSMPLPNRFVRSATWEGLAAPDGSVTPKLIEMMVELARGEVGLIISGYSFVSPEGRSSPGQLAIDDDRFLPGLAAMVEAVHAAGGKIASQIVHGGRFANFALTNLPPIGPSAADGNPACRAMTKDDIATIVSAFAQAAVRAKKAGFDAVQLHAAHGFLLSQFLSPTLNQRRDQYGGSLENRARFLLEVVRAIRQATGPAYPLLVKLNSEDFLDGGLTREEAVQVSLMLERASIDGIELSGGTAASPQKFRPTRAGKSKTPAAEVFYRQAAELYKQKVRLPLMLVGGIRSFDTAQRLVQDGVADLISLCRPLICEPALIKRWHLGDQRKSECDSCNSCFTPASDGRGVYCVTQELKRIKAAKRAKATG
ncbi:MAG: NADH:flavin oxidoreductase [Tepidisphaeraceae bacterium]|jgi:2,4-dienoyl-CoA reductase-like NADH-dependent reductase (Old Yellow Enzyme family)